MPELTIRSVLRVGDGGLAVTIPKGWAKYFGLRPKDKVEVVANGILRIRPPRKSPDRSYGRSKAF